MRTRGLMAGIMMAGALTLACNSTFGVEDAVGTWDTTSINGVSLPGAFWLYLASGDSTAIDAQSLFFEFETAPTCSYTQQLTGQAPVQFDDCTYSVAAGGDVSVTVSGGSVLSGTANGSAMLLADDIGNLYSLRKR